MKLKTRLPLSARLVKLCQKPEAQWHALMAQLDSLDNRATLRWYRASAEVLTRLEIRMLHHMKHPKKHARLVIYWQRVSNMERQLLERIDI